MKHIFYTLLIVLTIASTTTFAQDYTQWNLPEGAKARLGKGRITGNISYSPDGTKLAVASSIGVWIYDAQTGEELALLSGYTYYVDSVAFSPDGSILADVGGTFIILWDTNAFLPIRAIIGNKHWFTSVAFSPDGKKIVSGSGFGDMTVR